MTKKELEHKHPDYDSFLPEWQFFLRSYLGGKQYRDGNYLLQHPFESSANHLRRKASAYYYNYCAPVVDIFVSHLYKDPPQRKYGSLDKDFENVGSPFNQFWYNSDFEGATFDQFMREAQRYASIYGRVSIVVDRPAQIALTQAEAVERGLRPYLSLITPENILDWNYSRPVGGGEITLTMIKIKETENAEATQYRIWRIDNWELWEVLKDKSGTVNLVAKGAHNLGKVPVVNLYNKRSHIRMIGISDLQDISDINRNIYYFCSSAKEIIENTAFPMLAMPYDKGAGSSTEEVVGPKNILQFDPEVPNGSPFWLEPPHSSLTEIREWVMQDVDQINRIARTGGTTKLQDSVQPRSGIALEIEFQHLYAALREKADNAEQAEKEIFGLYSRWEGGKHFDGRIEYPDKFSISDIDLDLNRILQAAPLVNSFTLKKEIEKKAASILLPRLDEHIREIIMTEIDEGVEVVTPLEEEGKGLGVDKKDEGGAPEGGVPKQKQAAATGDIQAEALNGAQIGSLVEIVLAASQKQMPTETAKAIIMAAFPLLSTQIVDSIIKGLKGFTPADKKSEGGA